MPAQCENLNMVNSLPEWMVKGKSYQGGYVMGDDLIEKKGKWWYANCTYRGVRLRDSLKTTDRQTAIEHLFELQLLVREGRYQYHKLKFDALADDYAPKIDRANKLRNLKVHLMPAFKGKRLSEIDIQAWAGKISAKYKKSTTIAILGVAKDLGFKVDYQALTLNEGKTFDGSQILSEEMGLDVLDILASSARTKKYTGICRVAMYSTLSQTDLLHLRKMDVCLKGPSDHGITYIRRKTRHRNKPAIFIPMTDKLREAFKAIPTPINNDGLWFPDLNPDNVSSAAVNAFIKSGWPHGKGMHNFRHFGACYLIREGVPLATITELMGHSNFDTTLIYARTDREKLIEGVKKFDAK